jgi:DNA repair protein RecN (Recombination protein N)
MLSRLYIKDFTIVDELEIHFEPGFQVITGETGAGKSVLVGALGLLCGERGTTDLVRAGAAKAVLEAEFTFEQNLEVLKKLTQVESVDFDKTVLIRRDISVKGTGRAFINDTPVHLNDLGLVSSNLLDLHGQHQHQRLIHPEYHIHYLDAFARLQTELDRYTPLYRNYFTAVKDLQALINLRKTAFEKHDLYRFQIDELSRAHLQEDELEKLTAERRIMENSEQLFEMSKTVGDLLYTGEEALNKKLTSARNHLAKMAETDRQFTELLQGLDSARVSIEETGRFCEAYCSTLEFDPQRLESIRSREAELIWLLKKYQVDSVRELMEVHEKMTTEINLLENYDERIETLRRTAENYRLELQSLALEISERRKKAALQFEQEIEKLFESVGLKKARFQVHVSWHEDATGVVLEQGKKYAVNPAGMDTVEFHVGMNVGEPVRPLHKVASGGEISRIMLCLKALLAEMDDVATLVFDEIDSGISGRFAQIVGKKMHDIARRHQLIVITHLPQIAAQGTAHFSVSKTESNGRTSVRVKKLNNAERIEDIARLLGGEKITPQAIANARDLLSVTDA